MAARETGDNSLAAAGSPIDTSDLAQSAASRESSPNPDQVQEPSTSEPSAIPYPRFKEVNDEKNSEREARLRLEGELASERARAAQLAADLESARRPASQTGNGRVVVQGRYTSEQLENMIDTGTATRAQVLEYERETARIIARQEAEATLSQVTKSQPILEALNQFSALVPGWNVKGTENNAKAEREYQRLLDRGFAPGKNTELEALERAFGTVESLQTARRSKDLTATHRDTYQEGKSGRGESNPAANKDSRSLVQKLKEKSPEQYAYYQDLIRRDLMRGWPEVEGELKSALENPFDERVRMQTAELLGMNA